MINFHLMGHWRACRLDQKMDLVWPYPTNTNLMDITFDLQWRGVKVELRAENDLITSQLYCKLIKLSNYYYIGMRKSQLGGRGSLSAQTTN